MKSKWELFKEKNSGDPARPWDLINPNIKNVTIEIQEKRLKVCQSCDRFIKKTTQCKECGCIMKLKTKLPHASCPLNKWGEQNSVN
jgi:hypothetical protein